MDWIDPRYATLSHPEETGGKTKRKKRKAKRPRSPKVKPLASQVTAALAQPLEVWSVAFDHALSKLKWPSGCTAETTLLWSAVIQEQAEVLVRAGMSAKKLAAVIAGPAAATDDERAEQLAQVVGLMDRSLESMAFQWLDSSDTYAHSALATAALAWHLPDQARRPGNGWLTQWLQAVLDRTSTYRPDSDESVLCHLVLQCELPLLIGLATAASKRTVLAEASKAMDHLAEYLEKSEDNPAPWLAHGASYLRASLASVLRCRVLANSLGLRKWYPPQQKALAALLKHAARWCRPDGTQLLAAGNSSPRAKAIWEALAQQTRNPKSMAAAMTLSGIGAGRRSEVRKKVNVSSLPALTHYCADAEAVCMQSDWRQKGSRVAIDYSDTDICLEALGPKGYPILAGPWTARVELDGQAQLQLDGWQEVCWFSDDDADYLELEAQFGQHARVQRQAMWFREERLLLLADALLCEDGGEWSLQSELPLAADAQFEAETKTTEGFIHTSTGARCLALPLFLPEWRRQLSQSGEAARFAAQPEGLVARTEGSTNRLYAPTLISLCNSHARKPFTWRHLTVADELRIVPPNEAVAYRLQIGMEQWLVYRNLNRAVRRTTLGMHTMAEFYVGRFDADEGEVDTVVEVEPPDSE